ncbi:MAG TPA: UDP-N-acetylglucosamine 2-epimerase (non-hydrolyzing), partial [Longimicrobium sp.]|nr:UDP-N-acetylglucosamine 2-epimerase (non-hydrolyzing) [Longimicrobium sp.]
MQTVLCVFGTRPEAIKMAPVIRELRRRPDRFRCRVCVTAQHRDMLDQVMRLFGIEADYDLDVMASGQTPTQVAAAVLAGLEPVLQRERPDWVLVQGDTTTVAAAALAAYYARARVGHVEAGLRSHDKWQPFPEEINRRIAGVAADLHFAPTEQSRRNLLAEGVPDDAVHVTGNTVIDALHWSATIPPDEATRALLAEVGVGGGVGEGADGAPAGPRLILLTAHRRESF